MNRKKLIRTAAVLSLGVIWFVAVDWSWFVHDCPDCGHGEDVKQYRILGISVHDTVCEFPSVTQQVATDLGVPCHHPNMETWHKHRRWGLVYCRSPCINGICRLTGSETWYDPDAAAKVVALARSEPPLKAEFADRVFGQHDVDFLRVVLDRAGVEYPIAETRITK